MTERTGRRVQVLTPDGEAITSWDATCGGWLYGVCALSDGRVCVTSSTTHRLHLLSARVAPQTETLSARLKPPPPDGFEWGLTV